MSGEYLHVLGLVAEENADHDEEAHPDEREDRAALGAVDQWAAHGRGRLGEVERAAR